MSGNIFRLKLLKYKPPLMFLQITRYIYFSLLITFAKTV